MQRTYLDKIICNTFSRKEPPVLSFFFFIMGIASGASFSSIMAQSERLGVTEFIRDYFSAGGGAAYPSPFLYSFAVNVLLLAVIAVSGCFPFGFFVCFAALICKGMSLGFVCGILLEDFRLQGFLWILAAVLPQNIIIIPTFVLAGIIAMASSFSRVSAAKDGQLKKNRLINSGPYVFLYFVLSLFLLLAGIIESLLFPIVL